ncbi:MAG TPA: hypothetical protein VKZ18_14080 [Polyangia bacterium]|nr:hypothetical protein [Polyangia bacterium]
MRLTTLVATGLAALLLGGCGRGPEGAVCEQAADGGGQNECASGLTCQAPAGCSVSYCCPTPASRSSNANCNGSACGGS